MLIACGLGGMVVSVLGPATEWSLLACSGSALIIGIALAVWPGFAPPWASNVLVGLITAIVALAMHSVGADGTRAADGEVLFVLVAAYSFAFYPARTGFGQVAFAGAAYAWVLWGHGGAGAGVARWITTVGAMLAVGQMVRSTNREVDALVDELDAKADRDPLTGILNRRGLAERLGIEIARARRVGEPLTALAVDLDGLKPLNDRHGHAAGDDSLALVAHELGSSLRDIDVLARIGGDEFVILLPSCDQDSGAMIAENLCRAVRESSERESWPVTISAGVATAGPLPLDPELLLAAADSALYRAKALGRDRVARAGRAELRRAVQPG